MHTWGDGFPYFSDVGEAAEFIGRYCSQWGRIQVTQTKEKFGTARVYTYFGPSMIHGLLWPRRVYKHTKYPQWLWSLDVYYGSLLLRPFNKAILRWQKFVYRRAYKHAVQRWPHIKAEILAGADYIELLEREYRDA